jgi:hypothetical protein
MTVGVGLGLGLVLCAIAFTIGVVYHLIRAVIFGR